MSLHAHGSRIELLTASFAAIISQIYAAFAGVIDLKNLLNAAVIALVTGFFGGLAGAGAKFIISKLKDKYHGR